MSKSVHDCDGCAFFASGMCNYLLVMDVRRGCPAGAGCDKKMTKKEFRSMGIPKAWDKEAGRQMWLAGKGDAEIAKACGVAQGTISYFRKKHWETEAVEREGVQGREAGAGLDVSDNRDVSARIPHPALRATFSPGEGIAEAALAVPPPERLEAEAQCSVTEKQEDVKMPEKETLQSNDGVSREEYNQVVSWMVEAQRRADEAEAKVRKLEKAIVRMAVALYGGD